MACKQQRYMSEDIWSKLSEDLWLDILYRLSVESLLRCRCVCKTWYHIIGTAAFIETHLAYQNSSSNITNKYIYYDSKIGRLYRDFEFTFDDDTKHSKLYYTPQSFGRYSMLRDHGICNGLFCLSARCPRGPDRLYIWNPICRKVKKLPQLIINDDDDDDETHANVWVRGVSFGYYDDDYKVIVLSGVKTYTMCTYSLKANSWKIIHPRYPYENIFGRADVGIFVRFTRFVHGTTYMLTHNIFDHNYSVICLSLSDETIRMINFPQEFSPKPGFVNMEVYEDTIAVLGSCARLDSHYLDMWILRSSSCNSSSSWEKKFSIKLEECDSGRPYTIPLGFLSNGKYVVRNIVSGEDIRSRVVKLSCCDLESSKLTEYQSDVQLAVHGQRLLSRIHSNCVESLLLLNEDSLDPFVHTEMESNSSSSSSALLHST